MLEKNYWKLLLEEMSLWLMLDCGNKEQKKKRFKRMKLCKNKQQKSRSRLVEMFRWNNVSFKTAAESGGFKKDKKILCIRSIF